MFRGPAEDRQMIAELNGTYADGVVRNDPATWGSVWAENATWDFFGNLFVVQGVNSRVARYSPGPPRPDNLAGAQLSSLLGDNLYNGSGVGQKATVRTRATIATM